MMSDTLVVAPVWQATSAAPGSPEKILVMRQRSLARQPLFHPGDNRNADATTAYHYKLKMK